MNALARLLLDRAPDWAQITGHDEKWLRALVCPPKLSGAPGREFDLLIDTDAPAAGAREAQPGDRLPRSCPERHVNYDGSFCLGLNRSPIVSEADADKFWITLRTYLLSQDFADRNGRWPAGRGLSHGHAADYQLAAEAAARQCGLEEAYAAAIDHRTGWLAGPLPALVPADTCDHSSPLLSGETIDCNNTCDTCRGLAELISFEQMRRQADHEFVRYAKISRGCCETMPDCPLRS